VPVGAHRDVVEELGAVNLDPRVLFRRRDVDADHFVEVGDPQRAAEAAQPLRRVQRRKPIRSHHSAIEPELRDAALAILLCGLSVDLRHI
jgi:hypothetical protein